MSAAADDVSFWRHARAVLLLPVVNTIVVPSVLLTLWPPSGSRTAAGVAAGLAGCVLVLAGLALVVHSVRLFVRLGRGTLAPWDPTRALVCEGAYRYSRNPMKGGLFLILAGEALAMQSRALGVWFFSFALVNVLYIRLHEERGLATRFGARYRDYCGRVPRWWPKLATRRSRGVEGAAR
jgi:protein-S-isoprenylcysteine O-methyltransferase Ste14